MFASTQIEILAFRMSAFPPHRSIVSIPIDQEIALKYLSSYLFLAKTSPHLLPNARLEPSGPTAGSSSSSITIRNLERVEAGLRGEWLAPSLDLGEGNGVFEQGMDDGTNKGLDVEAENTGEGEGWMDLDEYQREQSIEGGGIGGHESGVVAQEGDSDLEPTRKNVKDGSLEVGVVDEVELTVDKITTAARKMNTKPGGGGKVSKGLEDKKARKNEKKLRHKAKLREQEAKRQKMNARD